MNSHPFDVFARLLARGISRRSVLRWMGASTAGVFVAGIGARSVQAANRRVSVVHQFDNGGGWFPDLPPVPPAEPWSPENPPDINEIIDDYLDCISGSRTPEACDAGFPGFDWCALFWEVITQAIPNLAGLTTTFTPFVRNCGERDCFQCCYNGRTGGCHSSYIGFPVINCNTGTYGEGTKPVGLTFIIDPDSVEPGDSCLFIPQVCAHIAQCVNPENVSASSGNGAGGMQSQQTLAEDYLTDPRAVDQRARYFAMQVQDEVQAYLDTYATDTPDARPLHTLVEALTNRGRAGWRSGLTNLPINITHSAVRINNTDGSLNESASWSNVAHLLGLARVLTGVPNLAARLAYVESRKWTQTEKDAYLAGAGDPYQALLSVLDPHWIAVLQRLLLLQDDALLAVPLEGEVATEGMYGGELLGKAPTLSLSATASGAEITLTVSIDDPEDVAGGLLRPVAVDWGDGHATHHALPSGQTSLDVRHVYGAAGRYAIYAVASNDSGLRGHAALVVESASGPTSQAAPATLPSIARIHLSDLTLTNLSAPKQFAVDARLVDAAGQGFRAGRSARVVRTDTYNIEAFGDLYAHNPARYDIVLLRLNPKNEQAGPPANSRVTYMTMGATMKLGVFSTATQQLVEQPVTLTPEMLQVYLAGATTPLPSNTVTVEANGALRIPLFRRATSSEPWQKVERIDIALTPAMFDGFILDDEPITAPIGTHRSGKEARPGVLAGTTSPLHRVMLPIVTR